MRPLPAGFFVLRTPLLPFDALEEWAGRGGDEAGLRALIARPEVAAALAEASPELVEAIARHGDAPWEEKLRAAVARYVLRMAGRPTPRGTLAAISTGRIGEETRLEVPAAIEARSGSGALSVGPAPVRNPTAHPVGDRLHLVHPRDERWHAVDGVPPFGDPAQLSPSMRAALLEHGVLVEATPPLTGPADPQQVDGVRAAPALTLGAQVARDLGAAAEVLCSLSPARPPAEIRHFADRFAARYGDAEVPLLESLDPEAGLGLETPPPALEWTARERRLLDAAASGEAEWALSERDLELLAPASPRPLPPAFAVLGSVGRAADGTVSLRVNGVSGPSGARLLARHAHADPVLHDALAEHLREEEALDPDALHAEVVHCPPGAPEDVVLRRPVLREHELVLLGVGGGTPIPLQAVALRIEDGHPVLRWCGRRVLPRLSSAHEFRASPCELYRFLALLQDPYGEGWVAWDWGPLGTATRLPRVRRGAIVLAPARWRVEAAELADPVGLRERLGLPRWIALCEHGRELPVDLENAAACSVLTRRSRRAEPVLLAELCPAPDALCARSEAGRHVHDLVVPFTAPGLRPASAPRTVARRDATVFVPGSEWTSVRLYCGASAADTVLLDAVAPRMAGLLADGRADRWFFLRYADPEWHLRLRVHGAVADALVDLGWDLHAAGLVWRFELDTYVRETERYGGPNAIEAAERAFWADSETVCALLAPRPSATERRHLAGAGVDALLRDAGAPPELLTGLRDGFLREQGATTPEARRALTRRLRAERPGLEALLADVPPALAARSGRWRADVAALSARGIASLAHLHVNRMLREDHRPQEAVIYDQLARVRASSDERVRSELA
jgi:thiopeptide-type bacteriocin biosynthesis protein